ncbi:magnesium transporter [Nitriliruptoraceae bacterium ZYF776]|nr:magnesium transporter [Profundirhabdus halotolerans]
MTTATLHDLLARRDLDGLDAWLEQHGALDVADALARLDPADRAVVFRLLGKDRALAVFEAFDPIHQQQLLDALADASVGELFLALDPDDRARLLDELPAKVANRLLAGLPEDARANTNVLLGYAEESTGRSMSPRYVSLRASMTAADALSKVRRAGLRPREVLVLPVTDDQRRLVGVVDLPDVVTADTTARVGDLIRPETFSVGVATDQEVAARLMQEADLVALPVLDTEERLVGVLTVDDAMEIIEAEETEDIARAGGSEPLPVPYLDAGVLLLARKRAVWLLVLIAAAVATVNVLQVFEETLEEVVALALFIPLLIDTGGNSGSQAATVVIRAMAVGEVRFADLPRILRRELTVGLLLGAMLGTVSLPLVTIFFGWEFAVVVGSTLLVICTWASFSGGLLPVVAKRLGIDPAVVSAPLITTLVDATGLILYFLIARAVLGL